MTSELSKVVLENSDKGFIKFLDVCKEVLNMYAPLKKKYIRGNNSPFMNRILSKEIMKRSRLRNEFLKSKSEADMKNHVKHKLLLSNKSVENENIILVEKEEMFTKDSSAAKVLNHFFSNIVKTLGISD